MLRRTHHLTDELRRRLARKAFALTAQYDAAISGWLLEQDAGEDAGKDNSSECASGGGGGGRGWR